MKIAVILFAFNRPKLLKKVLKSYNEQFLINADYYAFVDYSDVQYYMTYMICQSSSPYRVIIRNAHYGRNKNIIDGINEVFQKGYEAVIVLEDDLVLEPDALEFLQQQLVKYECENLVGAITCNKGTMCQKGWGKAWGIWKYTWQLMNFDDVDNSVWNIEMVKNFKRLDLYAIFSPIKRVFHIGRDEIHYRWYSNFGIRFLIRKYQNWRMMKEYHKV